MIFFAGARLQQSTCLGSPRALGGIGKLLRVHPENGFAMFGGKHNDAIGTRLIAKPLSGRQEYEGQNQTYHNVILPTGARIIPEQKAPDPADRTTHVDFSLTCGPDATRVGM